MSLFCDIIREHVSTTYMNCYLAIYTPNWDTKSTLWMRGSVYPFLKSKWILKCTYPYKKEVF